MPLAWKTLVFLAKRRGEWRINNTADDEPLTDDYQWAEWLLLAQLYQQGLSEELPVPTLADADEVIAQPGDEKAKKARQIQEEIIRRLKKNEPFWDLLLIGWMYQWVYHCSQEDPSCPTATMFAQFMRLSGPAFYRHYPNASQEIAKAYELVTTKQAKVELPDPGGREPGLKQSVKAKKPGFEALHYDPFADKEDTTGHLS